MFATCNFWIAFREHRSYDANPLNLDFAPDMAPSSPSSLSDIAAAMNALTPAARRANGCYATGAPGRPRGAKDRKPRKKKFNIAQDILRDFHKNHAAFLAAYRDENPDGYLQLIAANIAAEKGPARQKRFPK